MLNPTQLVIDTFVDMLEANYHRSYGLLQPETPKITAFCARVALENIANSDAPYHDLNHTVMVTQVGMEILRGKQMAEGGVGPGDWMHFIVALLCHDIGYVRGVCQGDREGSYVIDEAGQTVSPPPGATDAYLTPWHVARSKLFVRQRFGNVTVLDAKRIADTIEFTRFPVPEGDSFDDSIHYPGLLRAADLIGQLGDINYLKKTTALFAEFQETGTNAKLGYTSAADMRTAYPKFFWNAVRPYIEAALRHLQITQEGRQWIANLYANVFAAEHHAPGLCREL